MSEGGVELTREELAIVVAWGDQVQDEWGRFDPGGDWFWLWHRLAKRLGWPKKNRLQDVLPVATRKRVGQILRARGL